MGAVGAEEMLSKTEHEWASFAGQLLAIPSRHSSVGTPHHSLVHHRLRRVRPDCGSAERCAAVRSRPRTVGISNAHAVVQCLALWWCVLTTWRAGAAAR